MNLYCVRHGQSAYNAEGRIQGQCDVPLSPHGLRQSQALAEALAGLSIEEVIASPLARARQTALPVAERCGVPLRFDDRLKEIHAGIFQDRLWSEIRDTHPTEAARWIAQEPDFVIPQGESRRALMDRGLAAFDAIRRSGRERVVIVSHGGLLAAALKALLGIPADRRPFSFLNASISRAEWTGDFRLLTLNQTDHLRDVNGSDDGTTGDL
jgi:probable phosphoglycerate mutase